MISGKYRFHGQNGLRFVYRKGKTVRNKHCATKFTINPTRGEYRIAVVVSKKVAKSAPMRNRIRRRLYEQLRVQAPKYLTTHDVVVTVFDPELALLPAERIESVVKRILEDVKAAS